MSELLSIKLIKQDSALQPRAKMDIKIIDEYTEAMKTGASFPALVVYKVEDSYYLVDGYHRFMAAQGAKLTNILCEIRTGTMRDAILFSAGVNATHGLRRTNEDKRRAVLTLLRDKEWKDWADTKIAAACNVSVDLVANVRKSDLGETDSHRLKNFRKIERDGKVIKLNTSRIGKTRSESPSAPSITIQDTTRKEKFGGNEPVQPSLKAQLAGAVPPEPKKLYLPPCMGGTIEGCTYGKFLPGSLGKDSECAETGTSIHALPDGSCPFERGEEPAAPVTSGTLPCKTASKGCPQGLYDPAYHTCNFDSHPVHILKVQECPLVKEKILVTDMDTGKSTVITTCAAAPVPHSATPFFTVGSSNSDRPGYRITYPEVPPSEVAKHTRQFIADLPKQTQEEIDVLIKADHEGLFSEDPRELIIELIRERAEQLEAA
ncbi:MAG: ParB/RepB/Spo0J family partition protein [Methanoregula sp.]|nr:ParB/RepB/Spo0J family partition protein [Methanoregula sp.]